MIRPILSLKRLSFNEAQGQVIYQYGKHSTESEHMDYLEFIARVTSPIPDKGQVMIRYHGGFMPMPSPSSTCPAGTLEGCQPLPGAAYHNPSVIRFGLLVMNQLKLLGSG